MVQKYVFSLNVFVLMLPWAAAFPMLGLPSARISMAKMMIEPKKESSSMITEEVREEAKDALAAVGWAAPSDSEELTSDDPFVQSIDASIQREVGVSLEELLNPAKVNIRHKFFSGQYTTPKACFFL